MKHLVQFDDDLPRRNRVSETSLSRTPRRPTLERRDRATGNVNK